MIEIWQGCSSFQTTRNRLADQVRTIIKKGGFSDLEILEIHKKTNNEHDSNTISDTPSIDKQKQSNRNEPLISENRNATQPSNIKSNNTEQTLTQEQKKFRKFKENYELGKDYLTITKKHRIENSQDGSGKDKVLASISINNITELNEVIYAGMK